MLTPLGSTLTFPGRFSAFGQRLSKVIVWKPSHSYPTQDSSKGKSLLCRYQGRDYQVCIAVSSYYLILCPPLFHSQDITPHYNFVLCVSFCFLQNTISITSSSNVYLLSQKRIIGFKFYDISQVWPICSHRWLLPWLIIQFWIQNISPQNFKGLALLCSSIHHCWEAWL